MAGALEGDMFLGPKAEVSNNNPFLLKVLSELEIKLFSREPNCILYSFLKVLCIETSTFLGSLQKFEGAAGEFKGALGSWHHLTWSDT